LYSVRGNAIASDVRDPTDPRHRAFDAEPEARMHERPVLAKIQVPAVCVERQPLGLDPRGQLIVVVLALTASDDLPVSFRRQHVVVEHGTRVVRILLI